MQPWNLSNYLTGLVEKGQARLVSDLYPAEAVKGHPYRSHLTGMFYQGQQGKPLAIVVREADLSVM